MIVRSLFMEFVEKFTEINDGSAYFADLQKPRINDI